jgi:hypothetical protein
MTASLADPDALLLPRDVAALRHMTENALAQERWRGAGPRYVLDRRRVLYRASDLAEYLASKTVEPTPKPAVPQRD